MSMLELVMQHETIKSIVLQSKKRVPIFEASEQSLIVNIPKKIVFCIPLNV